MSGRSARKRQSRRVSASRPAAGRQACWAYRWADRCAAIGPGDALCRLGSAVRRARARELCDDERRACVCSETCRVLTRSNPKGPAPRDAELSQSRVRPYCDGRRRSPRYVFPNTVIQFPQSPQYLICVSRSDADLGGRGERDSPRGSSPPDRVFCLEPLMRRAADSTYASALSARLPRY